MSDEEALFQAICAEPGEDTPRLMYADCLEETGEPAKVSRAEFIRLQCRRWTGEDSSTTRDLLKRRERNLLRRWQVTWAAALSPRLKRARYARGFPEPDIEPTPKQWLALTEADLAGAPRWGLEIKWVHDPQFLAVATSPLLARFDLAFLSGEAASSPTHVVALATSPYVRSLRVLHLELPPGGGLRELAESESLAGLTSLSPRGNELGHDAVRTLARARFASNLVSLTLQEGLLSSDAADVFTSGVPFPQLRSLSLYPRYASPTPNDRSAILALVRSETLRNLTSLSITGVAGINDDVARAIAESPALSQLSSLHLTDTAVGEVGAQALIDSTTLTRLRYVGLYRNPCARSERAVAALRARFTQVGV